MKSIAHPYRDGAPAESRWRSTPIEELIFYVLLCLVGAIPVGTQMGAGSAFGVEATIGILMIAAGLTGLIAAVVAAARAK